MAKSIKQLRNELGAYLTRPLELSSGTMSTQQNFSATSLGSGGLEGNIQINGKGSIQIQDKVLIGYQLNGF